LFTDIFEAEMTFFMLLERKIAACIQALFFTQWVEEKASNDRMLKCCIINQLAPKDMNVINNIEFSARNLTSNAGLFLPLEHTKTVAEKQTLGTNAE
jgi:hypothetical protein